ncbi:MAG: hypothetical protein A2534_02280 [Candidatus Magasanikbacteria bacterium RIFOXYD2_FULL_39_9]|uniref:Uncharacterized protein n=1 Tax=Candidatus Magasanikbacteria bacterium RIFOXYD1_FULL_40_23 TaxID=1798705 RepID=A0A1F6PBK4_9BACT|nr:MAG: hypothetical protein A2534_02280 [Candidatus Magasanikbacteria bacterium RIFOXYD2_FULL_39_9]OGH93353.1 MAG: hypothetical protein A2563_01960 [Candidatus Magasanikbacteria bacterium RIFOXYD1_FULL_40_23]
MRELVMQAIQQAMNGSRKLRITFSQEFSQESARNLLTMMSVHLIWMLPQAWQALGFLSKNGHWGKNSNPVVEITLNQGDGGLGAIINEVFLSGIEKVEVVS